MVLIYNFLFEAVAVHSSHTPSNDPFVTDRATADGSCVIDVFHKDGVYGDVATISSISNAVWLVQEFCLKSRSRPPQGGWLRDLGTLPFHSAFVINNKI